jgi:hypothetical protein
MTYIPDQPKPSEFLASLGKLSHDLEWLVGEIKEARKSVVLRQEFSARPFAKDQEGNLKFSCIADSDPGLNLLGIFHSFGEVRDYTTGSGVEILEERSGLILTNDYQGPKVLLFPDTNVVTESKLKEFLRTLEQSPGIECYVPPIVSWEMSWGGLQAKFGDNVPEAIKRGQSALERKCKSLTSEQREELTIMFDVVGDYFRKQLRALFKVSDKSKSVSPQTIAEEFASSRDKLKDASYVRMLMKAVEHRRAGNSVNHIADTVLTTSCFGYNLVNGADRAVVVSNDRDLIALFNLFYDEILPRHMARTTIAAMKQRKPYLLKVPGYGEKMVRAAREHINWAKEDPSVPNFAAGVLYVPIERRFYKKEIAMPLRNYFNRVEEFRIGKGEVLSEMVLTGKGAQEVVNRLMGKGN